MGHLVGSEHDVRALVPAADEAYRFARDKVLRGGIVDPELKRLCFRYLAEDRRFFLGREPEAADGLGRALEAHVEGVIGAAEHAIGAREVDERAEQRLVVRDGVVVEPA